MAVVRSLQGIHPLLSQRPPVSDALAVGMILFVLVTVGVSFAASATTVTFQSTNPLPLMPPSCRAGPCRCWKHVIAVRRLPTTPARRRSTA